VSALKIKDLDAGYGELRVVRGLNLRVEAGEVVAFIGPNGAGKTTTLLTASGLLRPIRGRIELLDQSVDWRRPHRNVMRGLVQVPEDRSLFRTLTVAENLRLAQRPGVFGIKNAIQHFPALKPLMTRRVGLLSGGEQQMLAIARALLANPKVLMIDEMSLGLAPIIVERLLPAVASLARSMGIALLVVEQNVRLALEIADRCYVLNHGEVQLEGSASDLRRRQELLEASYLGAASESAAGGSGLSLIEKDR
jgi:branched-chain amino acid transport system ATP-binding protein